MTPSFPTRRSSDRRDPLAMSDAVRAVLDIATLTDTTLEARSGCPMDDVFTRWSQSEERGCPMSVQDINSELGLVVPGGAETTRTTMARSLILLRSEEHTSELQSLMRISYAVFCLKKKI